MAIITLTTDMGLKDHYVAVVKGSILGLFPQAVIVDVSHQITPFDNASRVRAAQRLSRVPERHRAPDRREPGRGRTDPSFGGYARRALVRRGGQWHFQPAVRWQAADLARIAYGERTRRCGLPCKGRARACCLPPGPRWCGGSHRRTHRQFPAAARLHPGHGPREHPRCGGACGHLRQRGHQHPPRPVRGLGEGPPLPHHFRPLAVRYSCT
ncbi:MAG: SAM-dependent chlorinase/fluorinase [Flavobacteriales bacterium]|nr:SAM-dependent chlorinase/fluorinase [Flavobacteriales bacterium]